MKLLAVTVALGLISIVAGAAAPDDPWAPLSFLEGTWEAHAAGADPKIQVNGTYSFKRELKDHVLVRHSADASDCKGPAAFDCDHHDMLYVYQDAEGQHLRGIYFDNEGHVIHYEVRTTEPGRVELLSPAGAGPQFRLVYQLKNGLMSGQFQMRMPGQAEWNSYLEWSGRKKKA